MPIFETRKEGIYRAKYLGCTEKILTNQDTGDEEPRLLWRFQEVNDSTTVGEISKWTGTSLKSANGNARKIATGIIGRPLRDGDDTETMVGQLYDVVYGPNQAGNLTVTGCVKVAEQKPRDAEADLPTPAVLAAESVPELP